MRYEIIQNKQDAANAARAGAYMIEHSQPKDTNWDAVLIELRASVKYAMRAKALVKKEFN